MGEQGNVAIVRQGYEAFSRGDIDGLLGLFDEHITWVTPGPEDLATAGRRSGRQQVREFFARVDELYQFDHFSPNTFVAEGDRVVVLGESTARLKPTNGKIEDKWAHVFTLKNGKIVAFEEYLDTAAVVGELRKTQART